MPTDRAPDFVHLDPCGPTPACVGHGGYLPRGDGTGASGFGPQFPGNQIASVATVYARDGRKTTQRCVMVPGVETPYLGILTGVDPNFAFAEFAFSDQGGVKWDSNGSHNYVVGF